MYAYTATAAGEPVGDGVAARLRVLVPEGERERVPVPLHEPDALGEPVPVALDEPVPDALDDGVPVGLAVALPVRDAAAVPEPVTEPDDEPVREPGSLR